jgi:hypothetical protein
MDDLRTSARTAENAIKNQSITITGTGFISVTFLKRKFIGQRNLKRFYSNNISNRLRYNSKGSKIIILSYKP